GTGGGDVEAPSTPASLWSTGSTTSSISLKWNSANDNIGVTAYELYSGANLLSSSITDTFYSVNNLTCNTSYSFTVKARDGAGNRSVSSNVLTVSTPACPPSGSELIYAEALHTSWTSSTNQCSADLASTTFRKSGTYSLKALFNARGQLNLIRSTGATTASTTQLRFWVYNTSKNGLKVSVYNSQGTKSSTDYFYKPSTNKWVEVMISLSQLGNPATIKQITVENNAKSGGTFYFDDIRLDQITSPAAANRETFKPVEEAFSPSLKIYPNPTRNHINIQFPAKQADQLHLELVDYSGRTLIRQAKQLTAGMNQWEFRFPDLPPGIYYLRFIEGTEIRVKPLHIR
ncbi:MAG: T9SS type A sorting domain-containing protein, partial [Chitinophagaceae bacterium]